jgi:cytosine/uracil/thiamine/allantoin permease
MVVDFFIIRKQRFYLPEYYKIDGLYWYWHGINLRAVAAFILSIVPNMPGLVNAVTPKYKVPQGALDLYTMSWVVGFVTAGFLLWFFHLVFPVPTDPPCHVLEGSDPGYNDELYNGVHTKKNTGIEALSEVVTEVKE